MIFESQHRGKWQLLQKGEKEKMSREEKGAKLLFSCSPFPLRQPD